METYDSTARPAGVPATWKDKQGGAFAFRAAWHYRDGAGVPVGIVARFDGDAGKQVIPFFKATDNGRFKAGGPPEPVLYGAERLNGHKAAALVVEGEKAAAALHSIGLLGVSAQGGAGKAASGKWDELLGVPGVVFMPDNDPPGLRYCRDAAAAMAATATPDSPLPDMRLLRLPVADKGDICDWIAERLPGWNEIDPVPVEHREPLRAELLSLLESAEPVPDDWLRVPEPKPERAQRTGPLGNRYVATPDGITWVFEKNNEIQEVPLCNFQARIVEELARDDGVESTLAMRLTGYQGGRAMPAIDMTWEQFVAMAWPAKQWTSACLVEPGTGIKDALRAAIQTLSHSQGATVERRTVFTHCGWRRIAGDWIYLHGGGGLGASGPVAGIETDLRDLARYTLPNPSKTPQERLQAAMASSGYLALAKLEITLPLLSCAFLAPLSQALNVDFALWLEAPSQSQKSSIVAVALAHFGAAIDRTSLTANWTGTPGSIEGTLFTLADSLACVDDYAPQPSSVEQSKLDATVSRIIRGCGNLQGRGRLKADLTRQVERYPRGLVISTGEQWPPGESLNARLFGVTLNRGDVNLAQLSIMQKSARSGLLGRCMADFLQDMAGKRETVIQECKDLWEGFRAKALAAGLTGRAPEQVAFLLVGAKLAANHYRAAGVELDTTQWAECLYGLAKRHATHVLESQPADRFRNALRELLAVGGACLYPLSFCNETEHSETPLRGKQIGWISEEKREVYLLAAPCLELVNESLRKGDTGLNIKPAALWRQCRQRGWLLHGDPLPGGCERSSRTCRINGDPLKVLVFSKPELLDGD